MTIQPKAAEQQVQDYLSRFRRAMKDADPEVIDDISNEFESHLKEQIAAETSLTPERLAELFTTLGEPEVLAVQYRTEVLIKVASRSSSPLVVVRAVFRWATLSGLGIASLMTAVIGYGISISLLVSALLKPVFPDRVGVWYRFPYLQIGFTKDPTQYVDLMGWWIIPFGIVTGVLFFVATTRLMKYLMWTFGPSGYKKVNAVN